MKSVKKYKNLFKLFILFLISLFSNLGPEIQAQVKLGKSPIKFTNQYYVYSITDSIAEIAGMKIDLQNIQETISELDLGADKVDTKCFSQASENYNLKICPSSTVKKPKLLNVYLNDELNDLVGSVVMQDLNSFVTLNIFNDKELIIEFKARKRAIAPYAVKKDINSNTANFTFIDLKRRKNIWETTLGIEELTFKLNSANESYVIYQDYIYVTAKPELQAFNFLLSLPPEVQYSYHRFGINGLVGFSSFTTNTQDFNSTLNSSVGFGAKVLYERNLDKIQTIYTNLIFYTAKISNVNNSATFLTNSFNLLDFNVGYKKYYDLNWAVSYELNYRNHFMTKESFTGSGQFEIEQAYTGSIGASPEYTLLETRQWNFIADASTHLILPQATPFGRSKIGFGWGVGLKTTYKLKSYRFYAGLNYDDRSFSASDVSFGNKDFIYSLGFFYIF